MIGAGWSEGGRVNNSSILMNRHVVKYMCLMFFFHLNKDLLRTQIDVEYLRYAFDELLKRPPDWKEARRQTLPARAEEPAGRSPAADLSAYDSATAYIFPAFLPCFPSGHFGKWKTIEQTNEPWASPSMLTANTTCPSLPVKKP